jgi:hypothetical protein
LAIVKVVPSHRSHGVSGRLRLQLGAKAQRASLFGDFCNKICHEPTHAVQ